MGCCHVKGGDVAQDASQERWVSEKGVVPGYGPQETFESENGTSVVSVQPAMFSAGYVIREPDTDRMRDRILAKALKSTLELGGDDDEDAVSDASSTSGAAVDQRLPLPIRAKDARVQHLHNHALSGLVANSALELPGQLSSGASNSPSSRGRKVDDNASAKRGDAKEELWRSTVAKRSVAERLLPYAKPPLEKPEVDAESVATTGAGSSRRHPGPHTLAWIEQEAAQVSGGRRTASPPLDLFKDLVSFDEAEPAENSGDHQSIAPSHGGTVSTSTVQSGLSSEFDAKGAAEELAPE